MSAPAPRAACTAAVLFAGFALLTAEQASLAHAKKKARTTNALARDRARVLATMQLAFPSALAITANNDTPIELCEPHQHVEVSFGTRAGRIATPGSLRALLQHHGHPRIVAIFGDYIRNPGAYGAEQCYGAFMLMVPLMLEVGSIDSDTALYLLANRAIFNSDLRASMQSGMVANGVAGPLYYQFELLTAQQNPLYSATDTIADSKLLWDSGGHGDLDLSCAVLNAQCLAQHGFGDAHPFVRITFTADAAVADSSRNAFFNQKSSMSSPAAAVHPPFTHSIVLVHSSDAVWDPFPVTVKKHDSLLLRGPRELLACNSMLLSPLVQVVQQRQAGPSEYIVGEYTLGLLHILGALHEIVLQQPASTALLVTVLSAHNFTAMDCADGAKPTIQLVALRASPLPATAPLFFNATHAATHASQIHVRFCTNWQHAITAPTAASAPVRAVYLPSLTWLHALGDKDRRLQIVQGLLGPAGVQLWPPTSWDYKLEQKDQIYTAFNRYMRPSRWITLVAIGGDLNRLATSLLQFCRSHGGDGDYYVKGSFSFAGRCATQIKVVGGQCPELLNLLTTYVQIEHQLCIGIQAFIPGFEQFELRTWLVADRSADPHVWRSALTLKTSVTHDGIITSELYLPIHGWSLRIARLVDRMLEEKAMFFNDLLDMGLPALRVDCGYLESDDTAFFSEFASAPDASMWSEVHGQDLAYVVGQAMGTQLWDKLQH